jgi:hypothetical protein
MRVNSTFQRKYRLDYPLLGRLGGNGPWPTAVLISRTAVWALILFDPPVHFVRAIQSKCRQRENQKEQKSPAIQQIARLMPIKKSR